METDAHLSAGSKQGRSLAIGQAQGLELSKGCARRMDYGTQQDCVPTTASRRWRCAQITIWL